MKRQIDGIARNNRKKGSSSKRGRTVLDESVDDLRKRFFLKALGIGGLSVFLYSMLPKKAQAMAFGSTMRATDPIGLKNVAGSQINPATAENQAVLNAKDFATQTTLAHIDTSISTIKTSTDKLIADPAKESTIDKRFNNKITMATVIALDGDNTILIPGLGKKIRLFWIGISVDSGNANDVLAIVKLGSTEHYRWNCGAFSHWQTIEGDTNEPLTVNLSTPTIVQINYTYEEI
ncbi:MAG: hypothetical protein PHW24_03155 [Candidatus Moranbacteria bacterium]|nr:hypothetical protein [Candidatus Moranbacteria bacterium]